MGSEWTDDDGHLTEWEQASRSRLSKSSDPKVRQLIDAARTKSSVDVIYHGGTTPGVSRRIWPGEVFRVDGYDSMYVEAYCEKREEMRTFRMDQISIRGDRAPAPSRMSSHSREAQSEAIAQDTPVAKLCRYYLACLAKDVERDVSEWASSQQGHIQYAEMAELPILPSTGASAWAQEDVRRILLRYRQERRQLVLYVGYPTQLVHITARDGREYWRVEPLFTFEYQFGQFDSAPQLADERPEIQLKALQRLTGVRGPDIFTQSQLLQSDLKLDAEVVAPEDLEGMFTSLPEIRPDWPWQEQIDSTRLSTSPPLKEVRTPGIYNRAILLTAERSPYTRGLISELKRLEEMPAREYRGTALEAWVCGQTQSINPTTDDGPLIEILPLNTEQREAVRRSLSRPLTVITGPPGTGKSQVVTSITVNCAWRGTPVLFASKLNKAVDVVGIRVNALGPRPLLLRLGAQEYQSQLAEYLASLLAATATAEDQAAFDRVGAVHQEKLGERSRLQAALDHLVKIRNDVDAKEQAVESIRQSIGNDWFLRLARVQHLPAAKALKTAQRVLDRATREKQGWLVRLFWSFIRSSRFTEALYAVADLEPLAAELGRPLSQQLLDYGDLPALQQYVNTLWQRAKAAKLIREYFRSLSKLRNAESSESVAHRSMALEEELAGICEELWRLWLRLQPSRLDPSDRKLLGDYKALLQIISHANETNQRVGGGVFRRFYEMFPKLTKLLPAWAVTNLSARGRLPMEAAFFDLLVIDEASQCDIASVLPLLYRCKRAVIIGDPKQLRHITQIQGQVEDELMSRHGILDIGARWSYTANSLFDLAASLSEAGDVIKLRDHHRSHADIIGFSNKYFYEGNLRIATRYDRLRFPNADDPAVRWVDVAGSVKRPPAGGAFNHAEAQAVVMELERLLVTQRYDGTVGVVSPFRAQANRIRDMVHQNDRLMAAIGQSELLVETVYKFQGDERDVMIFSPVVSRNTPRTALGFLRSNPNTFNVAITRARAALVVVGDRGACATSGVDHLSSFAAYVPDDSRHEDVETDFDADWGPEYPSVANPERVSDWERFFYKVLYREGLRPIPQRAVEQYRLDLVLLRHDDRKLDVEIDGEKHHRAWDGEIMRRDQIRNRRLIELGWDVMRFWVYQIRDETNACVERVVRWMNEGEA